MTSPRNLPGSIQTKRIFAIGDVHGQAGALSKAFSHIRRAAKGQAGTKLVLLGDWIDRGPSNLAVIDMVMNAKVYCGVDEVVWVTGNHELMLRSAIANPEQHMMWWLKNGGEALLDEVDPDRHCQSVQQCAATLKKELAAFLDFLETKAVAHHRDGDLLFVHAGVSPYEAIDTFLAKPGLPIGDMHHWAWVREAFLSQTSGWDPLGRLVIVHGHTNHNCTPYLTAKNAGAILSGKTEAKFGKAESYYAYDFMDRVDQSRRICLDVGSSHCDQLGFMEVTREGDVATYTLDLIHEMAPNLSLDSFPET